MAIIYREIDPKNYEEVYNFNLLHEYSWRDSSNSYIPDSEQERERKAKKVVDELSGSSQKYHCLAAFDGNRMIAAHFLDRYEIDKQPACHIHHFRPDTEKIYSPRDTTSRA